MNRSIILSVTLTILLVPQLVFAAWWNPLSWFSNWSFPDEQDAQTQILEERIKELENKLSDVVATTTVTSTTTTKKEVASLPKVKMQPPTTKASNQSPYQAQIQAQSLQPADVCLNIEGIQSQVPGGFSSTANICTPIEVKDLCPNIAGVQPTIPEGKFIYRSTNECLTLSEIDAIEETDSLLKGKAKQEAQILSYKKELVAKIDLYNRFILEINTNYYGCEVDHTNSCPDPYTPKNTIPQELKIIMSKAPYSATGGGNTKILTKNTGLAEYVKEQINFLLFDLNAEHRQL